MSNRIASIFALAVIACFSFLQGCGNGSVASVTRETKVELRIAWPEKTKLAANGRYIPSYASSLYLELYLTKTPTKRYALVANRPTDKPSVQAVSFSGLIVEGEYTLAAAARTGVDGLGATVASGLTPVSVKAGLNTVELSLSTSITKLVIPGQPLNALIGANLKLLGQALDADGKQILVPDSALVWSVVSGGNFGSVTPAGLLTPTASGTIRVRFLETGTGLAVEADVAISNNNIPIFLAKSSYPKEYGDVANSSYVTGTGAKGTIAWVKKLGNIGVGSAYFGSPTLGGNGILYTLFNSGIVGDTAIQATALSTADGSILWKAPILGGAPSSPVALSNHSVVYSTNDGLVSLDSTTGSERWRKSIAFAGPLNLNSSGNIILNSSKGLSYLDARSGNEISNIAGVATQDTGYTNAVGSDGKVFYINGQAGAQAFIRAFDLANQQIWTVPGIFSRAAVVAPNGWVYLRVFQNSFVHKLVAYDPGTGAIKAEADGVNFDFDANIAVDKDSNIYVSVGNSVQAYSPTLAPIWNSPLDASITRPRDSSAHRITIGSDATLYVIGDTGGNTDEGKVYAINTANGARKWEAPFVGASYSCPVLDSDGTLYILAVGSGGHSVIAIR